MDNSETLATSGTQDTGQTQKKTQHMDPTKNRG